MFTGLFSYDNAIARFFRTIGYIWYLHILWLITSIPIFTLGASSTALQYAMMKLHKDEGYPTENFFKSFKMNFKQSTQLFCIYLAIGVILALDLILGNQLAAQGGRFLWIFALILGVPYLLSLIYVFAVQARFSNTILNTMKYAFGLSIKNMKFTIQLFVLIGAVIYLNTWLIICNFVTLVFGIGLLVFFCTFYYNRIFEPYVNPKQEEETEEEEQETNRAILKNESRQGV